MKNGNTNELSRYLIRPNSYRKLLYFLIFFSFLLSMRIWLGWEDRAYRLNMFIGIFALFLMLFKRIAFSFTRINIITFLVLVIAHFFCGYKTSLFTPLYFLPYLVIICLNDIDKIRCLDYITQWYGYLMIPSIIVYALVSFVDLPYFGIQHASNADWAQVSGYGICKNYIFYMKSEFGDYATRFNGPFLEPGHVGMISAFLLFVNHFNFNKKGMWYILIALLLTLSLAGYALLLIGFSLFLYYKHMIKTEYVILCFFLLFSFYLSAIYYNGGDNIINEKILSRLQYDEEKGFVGNNRVFGLIDIYYAALWTDTHTLLWGYPPKIIEWLSDNNSRGTGYIMSMCMHGLVGTSLSVLCYFVYAYMNKYKRYAVLCVFFVLFMFWQRCYPFWSSWIICFIYGIVYEKFRIENIGEK